VAGKGGYGKLAVPGTGYSVRFGGYAGGMTKAELRAAYEREREAFAAGERWTNEYALHLDTMLSQYFNLPLADFEEE
jgi:hypothetical protein